MVFQDLSAPEACPPKNSAHWPMAFVRDRFLAFFLDFMIFSPVVSLCCAGFLRQAKTFFLLQNDSLEGYISWALMLVVAFVVSVLLQSAFLFFWQATPGQLFMQIRVVNYPVPRSRLTLGQCLQRSLFWNMSFLLLGVPFLEVVSHLRRRAFYDRASDTLVVTHKQVCAPAPLPFETRMVSSWMHLFYFAMALVAAMLFGRTYFLLQKDYFAQTEQKAALCAEVPASEVSEHHRLDAVMTLFLMNKVSSDCLVQEADHELWSEGDNASALAYLAKSLVAETLTEQRKYVAKVCALDKKEICQLAHYIHDEDQGTQILGEHPILLSTRFLILEDQLENGHYMAALSSVQSLQKEKVLKSALEKRYVSAVWALNEHLQHHHGREPASADEQTAVQEFKDKYGVP